MISLSVNDLGGRADLLQPRIMKHLGVRFLHVPSPQHFHFSLPYISPLQSFLSPNETILLANLGIQFADFPLKRFPVRPYSSKIDHLMRITVRNSRKVRGGEPPIHNPQDFHGTRGPRECTSLIGDAQIQPFFIFSLLGMHTCFSIQHHSTAQVPGGGPREAPLSPPLFPLPSQEQTSLVPTPPAFSCFFLLRHRFLPSLRTERNLSRFPFREAGTSQSKMPPFTKLLSDLP